MVTERKTIIIRGTKLRAGFIVSVESLVPYREFTRQPYRKGLVAFAACGMGDSLTVTYIPCCMRAPTPNQKLFSKVKLFCIRVEDGLHGCGLYHSYGVNLKDKNRKEERRKREEGYFESQF